VSANATRRLRRLGLASCLLIALPFAAAATPAVDTPQTIDLTRLSDLTIRWQAWTAEEGGSFQIYAGAARDEMRLIGERAAGAGLARYTHRADAPELDGYFFELRYLHPDGSEEVLETAFVRHRELEPAAVESSSGQSATAVVARVRAFRPRLGSDRVRAETTGGRARGAEPETPPPRA